ncbi:MAG: ABC transporter permease [Verrucomicrobiota bacterium]|jgi:hypothetical protein
MKPEHRTSLAYALPDWFRAPILPLLLGKELRVLMPVWLLTMAVLFFSTLGANPEPGVALAVAINVLGCLVLGATVFGHEFNHRTLPLLLAQPVTRPAVWRAKMGILLALVLIASLSTAAVVVVLGTRFPMNDLESFLLVVGCTVLSAVGVAPWMTLLTRSTLAGAVFAGALPLLLWGAANLLGWALFGSTPEDTFVWVCFLVPLIGHWVAAPFLGYRAFVRLQVLDGPNADLHLPQWLARLLPARAARSTAPRHTGVLWQLVKKELRLQQTTFLITGLFVLAVVAASVVELVRVRGDLSSRFYVEPLIWLQALVIPLLAGALCCAEERQHGTIEWQLVQPLAAWRQWLVKVGVALGLTELLAVGLPLLLLLASPFAEARHEFTDAWWVTSTVVLLLGSVAIYFSALCQTTVRALLWTVAVASVTLIAVATVANNFDHLSWQLMGDSANLFSITEVAGYALAGWVWLGVGAVALLALMVGCGFGHFRRVDRSVRRVLGHIGWFGLALAVWTAGSLALLLNARWVLDQHILAQAQAQAANPPPKPAPWRLDQALFKNNGTLELSVDKLLAAAVNFQRDQAAAGSAVSDSIPLSELVNRHWIASDAVRDFDGMETAVVLSARPALPEAVLLRVTSPTGLKMVVFANGHMELTACHNMDQVALALSLFLLNHPTAPLFQNERPNPLLTQAVPAVDWDDVEIQVPTTAALQQAVRESPMTILARSKAPGPWSGRWQRFYVLADGSVRRQEHRTREEAWSGIFTDPSPRPMMDIHMMMRYGLVPKGFKITQQPDGVGAAAGEPATAGATGAGNPLSWSPPDNGASTLRMRYSLPGSRPAAEAAVASATIFETDTNSPATLATNLLWAELDQIRLAGWALRAFASDAEAKPLWLDDGRLNPAVTNLAPGVNWSDVAVLVADRATLKRALQHAPQTIIARSRSVAPSPDGRWQRFYALANGSVHGRMDDRPETALRGSWPERKLPKGVAIRYGIRPPSPAANAGGNGPQPSR